MAENEPISVDDLRAMDVEEIINSAKTKECGYYSDGFFARSKEAEKAGNTELAQAYRLMGGVTSMAVKSERTNEPFRPFYTSAQGRSATSSDFSNEELESLGQFLPEVKDPDLRARIADLLWVRKRDFRMAELAITAYLESSAVLEHPKNWLYCFHKIERAFRLGVQLGRKTGHFDRVVGQIESLLDKYNGEDPLYLSEKLMGLLCEHGMGDTVKYAALSEKLAMRAESESDWNRAKTYWDRKVVWHRIAQDEKSMRDSQERAAEIYLRLAEASVTGSSPSYMVASTHLEKAIEAFRRIGMKERASEIHKTLLEYQPKMLAEMAPISTDLDLNDAKAQAKARVKGKSFADSILELSLMLAPQKVMGLKKTIEENVKEAPLTYLMGGVKVNEKGKTIGKRPGLLTDTKEKYEEALQSHMFSEAQFGFHIDAQATIEPVRRQINLEHNYRIDDFSSTVANNPLIPEGREYIYAQGLHAGMDGDFVTTMSLLVPQFENSVRFLLEKRGLPTSSLNSEGIQQEYDLNTTLRMPETEKIFGGDLTFTLRSLLIERDGANIRNRMAHGLMSHGEFYSSDCIYLWSMILRLCCWPSIVRIHNERLKKAE